MTWTLHRRPSRRRRNGSSTSAPSDADQSSSSARSTPVRPSSIASRKGRLADATVGTHAPGVEIRIHPSGRAGAYARDGLDEFDRDSMVRKQEELYAWIGPENRS